MSDKKPKMKLTSVKISPVLQKEFKHLSISTEISLQKLVNRSLYLYVTEQEFRDKIYDVNIPEKYQTFEEQKSIDTIKE